MASLTLPVALALFALMVVYLFYRWSIATFDYFALWSFFVGQKTITDALSEGYHQFPGSRFSGFFSFREPAFLIHDPELVKRITVGDFDHFVDHSFEIPMELDPFLGRSVFFAEGQRWRQGRTSLSPAFTGSKMRNMFELLSGYCDRAMKGLLEMGGGVREAKDLFQRFGNDIMASIALGLDIDSVRDPQNVCLEKSKRLTALGGIQGLKFFLATMVQPKLFTFFGIKLTSKDVVDFFEGLISKTIKHREENKITRPDFIHLLLQARRKELKQDNSDEQLSSAGFSTVQEHLSSSQGTLRWTDQEIASAVASFFFGGIETTSTALCFALYELCLNPEIQDKLREEIQGVPVMTANISWDSVQQDLGDEKLSYEVIQKMQYLDMVLTETLRLWTPQGITNRKCTREYVMENSDGTRVTVEKGQVVQIPLQAIHRDSRYYPEPLKFDPERFSVENRRNINRDAFLVFGSGPRNCIGSRLALMQAKCLLYYLIGSFTVEVSNRLDVPIQLDRRSVGVNAKNGFWFNFVPRRVS